MKKIVKILAVLALSAVMFTACSSKKEAKEYTSAELADIINRRGGEMAEYNPAIAMNSQEEDENLSFFYEMYGWDKADIREGAMSFSLMNVTAFNIAIVKPAEGREDRVKEAFEDYKAKMVQSFENYLEEPLKIAQDTIIESKGDYIIMVMCEDSQSVYESITEKLE